MKTAEKVLDILEKVLDILGKPINFNFGILLTSLLASLALLLIVIHFVSKKRFKKEQDDLFQDEDALAILFELYKYHPRAVNLPIYNQKVLLLQHYQLITRTTSETVVSDITDITDPKFPYILQPEAERRIKELVAKESST